MSVKAKIKSIFSTIMNSENVFGQNCEAPCDFLPVEEEENQWLNTFVWDNDENWIYNMNWDPLFTHDSPAA